MDGTGALFPPTRHSAVRASRSGDPAERQRALGTLIGCYWKPAYRHVRLKWRADHEEAQDLVQGFFADALQRELLQAFDPARARFRTWVRTCLDGFVGNERKAQGRAKRGGGIAPLSLDFAAAQDDFTRSGHGGAEPVDPREAETAFDREWRAGLLETALHRLRERCRDRDRGLALRLFERHDLGEDSSPPTYADLARETGLPVTQVTHQLAWARREFRALVLEVLRELTGSEGEYRDEVRELLGRPQP